MAEERSQEPIFPITNRRAPLLERIRGRKNGSSDPEKAARLSAEVIGKLSLEEESEETVSSVAEQFRSQLSNVLGVEPEQINDDLVQEFSVMFGGLDETDLVDIDEEVEEVEDESEGEEDSTDEDEDSIF